MHEAAGSPCPVALSIEDVVLPDDLFVVPDGDACLAYAPRTLGVARVNRATARHLDAVRRGAADLASLPEPVLDALVGAGVLVGRDGSGDPLSLPPKTAYDPDGITLTLTTRCTMACTYCYANGGDRPRMMDWATAKHALDWVLEHARDTGRTHVPVMFHGGGEVTAASLLLKQCVSHARARGRELGITVSTSAGLNGVVTGPLLEWVIANIEGATISLDGLPEIHNAQRPLVTGRESFPIVARALHRMDEAGFNYGIRSTVTRWSLPRVVESVEFICRTFQTKVIHLEPMFQVGRAFDNALGFPDPHAFVDAYRTARAVARSFGRDLKYSGARFGVITNKFCQVCDDLLAITPDGQVSACYEVGDPDDPRAPTFFYGRLDPVSGALEIDEAKAARLRTLTVEHKPACQDCFCKWSCAGECASKLALAGSPWDTAGNPRCVVNRELTLDQMRDYLACGGRPPAPPAATGDA